MSISERPKYGGEEETTKSGVSTRRREALKSLSEADWEEDTSNVVVNVEKSDSVPSAAKGVGYVLSNVSPAWRGPILLLMFAAGLLAAKVFGWTP